MNRPALKMKAELGMAARLTENNMQPSSPVAADGNRRILVVEDEREIAAAYQSILGPPNGNVVPLRRSSRGAATPSTSEAIASHEYFEVSIAHSATQALDLVHQALRQGRPFAMGFFDVMLGAGMDGIELVREIHKLDPLMQAVFVTAYNDRSVDSIHELLGVNMADRWDYLNKPFSDGEILQKARNTVTLWNLLREKERHETQLAEAHRQLLESERMNAVATVARGVGHEFGNILVQIMGRAELSLKGSDEDRKKAIEKILKASETASHILERFRDLARPSAHEKTPVSLEQPVREALDLLDHQLKVSNVRVCRIRNDHVEVPACAASLVQVFVNLIINAIHAMPNSGQIDISIKKEEKWAEIRVRDYGPGIPPDVLEHVAEPFFTTKGEKGTGLGLAICKEIVEIEHQGQFLVTNHCFKGAEFVLRLPYKHEGGEHYE